jgi:Thioredoxin
MQKYLANSMTFEQYLGLIDKLLAEGKTTGPVQSEAMLNYARINRQRMLRVAKTVAIEDSLRASMSAVGHSMIWLIITEGWCGDAAQNIPAIEKIAEIDPGITTRYVLRDQNPELMDKFLTRGGRSIPKLIALDAQTLEVLGTWGPRSGDAQTHFDNLKANGLEKTEIAENMQRWYNDDRSRSLQSEFAHLVPEWAPVGHKGIAAGKTV